MQVSSAWTRTPGSIEPEKLRESLPRLMSLISTVDVQLLGLLRDSLAASHTGERPKRRIVWFDFVVALMFSCLKSNKKRLKCQPFSFQRFNVSACFQRFSFQRFSF